MNDLSIYWMPHRHCVLDDKTVILFDTAGNLLVALASLLIPVILLYACGRFWKSAAPALRELLFHAACFVLLCGFTHLVHVWNWWNTNYTLESGAQIITGLVSIAFVVRIYGFIHSLHMPE